MSISLQFLRIIIGLLLLLVPDMEPVTLLISQSAHRVQTSLFMLDSSSLEPMCDALGLTNVLICDPTDQREIINRKEQRYNKICSKTLWMDEFVSFSVSKDAQRVTHCGFNFAVKQSGFLSYKNYTNTHEVFFGLFRTALTAQLTWRCCCCAIIIKVGAASSKPDGLSKTRTFQSI